MAENFAYSSPEPPETGDRLELAQEIRELKQALATNAQSTGDEIERLRTQTKWLTGLFIASVVALGGILAGVTFSLRNEQAQLVQQIDSLDNQVNTERLESLESQINALSEQVNTLSEEETDNGLLQRLVTSIRENLSNPTINRQLNRLNELLENSQQQSEPEPEPPSEAAQ